MGAFLAVRASGQDGTPPNRSLASASGWQGQHTTTTGVLVDSEGIFCRPPHQIPGFGASSIGVRAGRSRLGLPRAYSRNLRSNGASQTGLIEAFWKPAVSSMFVGRSQALTCGFKECGMAVEKRRRRLGLNGHQRPRRNPIPLHKLVMET